MDHLHMPAWTPEKLLAWAHERSVGMQMRSQWLFYPKYGKITDPLPKERPVGRKAFTKDNHYTVYGCNIHDKSEWIRYLHEGAA